MNSFILRFYLLFCQLICFILIFKCFKVKRNEYLNVFISLTLCLYILCHQTLVSDAGWFSTSPNSTEKALTNDVLNADRCATMKKSWDVTLYSLEVCNLFVNWNLELEFGCDILFTHGMQSFCKLEF